MANLFKEKPIVKVVMLKGQDGEEKLINQADGSGLSFWIGTQAEYDAIPEAELIANCVYYITDDTRDDFNTRLNELDTQVNEYLTYLTKQNQVLWEGAVNENSTTAEKLLTANGIGNYNLVALVVNGSASGIAGSATILAYRTPRGTFEAGNNFDPSVEVFAGIVIENDNQCRFVFADQKVQGTTSHIYLRKIIGVM